MKKWLRRIRGVVGMGLTWAAIWFGLGAIFAVSYGATVNVELFANALAVAVMGFIGGAIFSTALGIAEGRRTFDEMSLPSFAVLGAVGGIFVSMLLGGTDVGLFALLGAGSAAGSLALARRSAPLLESGESDGLLEGEYTAAEGGADIGPDFDDIGLTEEEKRELLAQQEGLAPVCGRY